MLEVIAFRKALRQSLHQFSDEFVGLFHGMPRLIDKTSLNFAPAVAKIAIYAIVEKRLKRRYTAVSAVL